MIAEQELRRIAGRFDLGVGQAEHEYAMLCVLDALGQTAVASDTFCLKGGTALRGIQVDTKWSLKKKRTPLISR